METVPYAPTHADLAEKLAAAYIEYLQLLGEASARMLPCPSWWPADPPGPGYVGTRCAQLQDGHTEHSCRVPGSHTVVRW